MGELPAASHRASLRARRWDAIILGSALPGLVAAARLGMAGHRVLVVEEESPTRAGTPLREPFLIAGGVGGVLGTCLRKLSLPLIDLRRIEPDPLAYQVVFPDARIDVGDLHRTAEELVAWGLAKPEVAEAVLRGLTTAAAAERDALLEAPVVRAWGLRGRGLGGKSAPRHARGLPGEIASPPAELVPFLDSQVRALSNLGDSTPSPEARARLLGTGLEGGAAFATSELNLHGLLRRRVKAVHGEFRIPGAGFALVSVGNQPGIAPARSSELWVGRTLILNAPRGLLPEVLAESEAPLPSLLEVPLPTHRRVFVHLQTDRENLPVGMARRVIRVLDPTRPLAGTNVVSIARYPNTPTGNRVDVIASAVVSLARDSIPEAEGIIEETVRSLMPFAEDRLSRRELDRPRWDDAASLSDPPSGEGWPGEAEIRLSSKPPIYELPRPALASLGVEGDVLLGWRAGDRIAAELG